MHVAMRLVVGFAIVMSGCANKETSAGSSSSSSGGAAALTFPIVDTGQVFCYGTGAATACPQEGGVFHGQDAQYQGNPSSHTRSADGLTVHDEVTGLTWQRTPDTNGDGVVTVGDKFTHAGAAAQCAALNTSHLGGFEDWRLPSIKELYSLIDFRGTDPSSGSTVDGLTPFIDDTAFQFAYGDTAAGERIIDSQYASSTLYVTQGFLGDKLFGVNFADGRIKGYDLQMPGSSAEKTFLVQCVRGNPSYGINALRDNGDQTVMDEATGLTWSQDDSGTAMEWEEALAWVASRNAASHLGHSDWRMPNVKELQGIVDYTRSPDSTQSAAIDPIFHVTGITNEDGVADFPWYWSSTTHVGSNGMGAGAYVAFGRAGGWFKVPSTASCYTFYDVHGAGAQRGDPKTAGNLNVMGQACNGGTAYGLGPQGDVLRGRNFVRLVRGGATPGERDGGPLPDASMSMPPQDGGGGMGPTSCTVQADCEVAGACPGTLGCTCSQTPMGNACIPRCSTTADCPTPPGMTLTCGANGLCVPG